MLHIILLIFLISKELHPYSCNYSSFIPKIIWPGTWIQHLITFVIIFRAFRWVEEVTQIVSISRTIPTPITKSIVVSFVY